MITVHYLPAALEALDEIYTDTVEHWGEAQADAYVGGVFTLCESIPQCRHRRIPAIYGVDGFVTAYKKHLIYWRRPAEDKVIIVCILHERMDQAGRLQSGDFEA